MRGTVDLVLLVGVVLTAWTRTPAGDVALALRAAWRDAEPPDLLATFDTAVSRGVTDTVERLPAVRPAPPLELAVTAHLGEQAWQAVAHAADPERALEEWAIGAEARTTAVRRAQAARVQAPESYEGHRRFLDGSLRREADRAVRETLALATALDLRWPVDKSARVSSPFGERTHPVLGVKRHHDGVDLAIPVGTPVWAAGVGSVRRAAHDPVNGHHVILDHGAGVTTSYAHAESLAVGAGSEVHTGDTLLHSGTSGRSTGPHLHFGLRIHGRAVDPLPLRAAVTAPGSRS